LKTMKNNSGFGLNRDPGSRQTIVVSRNRKSERSLKILVSILRYSYRLFIMVGIIYVYIVVIINMIR